MIIPFSVKRMRSQLELREFGIADFDAGIVGIRVQRSADGQPGFRCRAADEIDDCLMAEERLAAPVLRNEAEQAMFNLDAFVKTRNRSKKRPWR